MPRLGLYRWVVATLATCLIVGCSSPEERVAAHVERAEALGEAGEVDEAILEYRSALKIDASHVVANEGIGDLLLRQGDLSGTWYLSEALRLEPERIGLAMRLARILLVTGQVDEAGTVIAAAKTVHPDAGVVYGTEAELLLHRNDPDAALVAALKAVELDPEDADLWLQLGRVHQGRMRMDELTKKRVDRETRAQSIAAFEKADELAGGMVRARIERARMIGQSAQNRAAAEKAYIEAVELAEEQNAPELQYLAASAAEEFAIQRNRHDFRIWAIRQMLEADPSQLKLWAKLATLLDGATKLGIIVYGELLEKRPDDPRAHILYTSYLVERQHPAEAVRHLEETIEGGLESPLLFEQLVRLQIVQGRIAKARATFVKMSDEFPDEVATARAEARIALFERRDEDAIEILRDRVSDMESFEYHRMLAVAYYRSGDLDSASDSIDRALELRDDFAVEGVRLRALIHHDAGEWKQTLRTLAALNARGQKLSVTNELMRVRALYGLGLPEKALPVLEKILAGEHPPSAAALLFAEHEGANRRTEATRYLIAARDRDPASLEVLEALVDIELRAGHPDRALFFVRAALQGRQAKPEILLMRARLLHVTGENESAEADALRAFEADPALPGAIDLLYAIYESQGRLDEARTSFEEAEAAGVLHSGARLLLCRIYIRQGEVALARTMLEKVVREDPDTATAKTELAFLLADIEGTGNLDRALVLAEDAQASLQSDPTAADTVGYVYLRKGEHEAALQQFLHAIALNGDRSSAVAPKLHYHMGLTLDALSRSDEAAAAFEKALTLDANFPEAEDARRRLERAGRPS